MCPSQSFWPTSSGQAEKKRLKENVIYSFGKNDTFSNKNCFQMELYEKVIVSIDAIWTCNYS